MKTLTKPSHTKTKNREETRDAAVLDAHAWVEYALNGPHADMIAAKLSSAHHPLTPATAIGELKEAMQRQHIPKSKISTVLLYVKNKSTVVNIDAEIAEKAAETNFQHKKTIKGWGMLDSIVYAVTILKKGRVITGDPHFKNLPQVTYIGT